MSKANCILLPQATNSKWPVWPVWGREYLGPVPVVHLWNLYPFVCQHWKSKTSKSVLD